MHSRFISSALPAGALLLATLISAGLCRAEGAITNVRIEEREGKYEISYDLNSPVPGFVDLIGSSDGGQTYDILMEHVQGDVGKRIPQGEGLRIIWEAEKDLIGDLKGADVIVYPSFSFQRRNYREASEIEPVRTNKEYQEELRREHEEYSSWIVDSEAKIQELIRERSILQERLAGLQLQTPLLSLSAGSDRRERKRAEKAEKERAKDIESLQKDLAGLDRDIEELRGKVRQLKAERGDLE